MAHYSSVNGDSRLHNVSQRCAVLPFHASHVAVPGNKWRTLHEIFGKLSVYVSQISHNNNFHEYHVTLKGWYYPFMRVISLYKPYFSECWPRCMLDRSVYQPTQWTVANVQCPSRWTLPLVMSLKHRKRQIFKRLVIALTPGGIISPL